MAEGYLRHFSNPKTTTIYSAGVETHGVNPKAISTMADDGIDISNHTSNHIDDYANIVFNYVITVCDNAKEACPFFPTTAQKFHHNFQDPSKLKGDATVINNAFKTTRNHIKAYIKAFADEHNL